MLPCWEARDSGVRNHAGHLRVVGIGDEYTLAQFALRLLILRREDMAHLGLVPLDFAGASLRKALGRARMGLQLGHGLLNVRIVSAVPHFGWQKLASPRHFPVYQSRGRAANPGATKTGPTHLILALSGIAASY